MRKEERGEFANYFHWRHKQAESISHVISKGGTRKEGGFPTSTSLVKSVAVYVFQAQEYLGGVLI